MSWKLALTSRRVYNLIATLVGVGLFIFLVLSLNALFASRSQLPTQPESNRSLSQSSQPLSSTSLSPPDQMGPTAGWQLYTSETGRFEIKYPPEWFIYDKEQWEYDNRVKGCEGSFTPVAYNEKGQPMEVDALILSRQNLGRCIRYGREWSQWPGDFTIRVFPSERSPFELGKKQIYQVIEIDGERAVKYPFTEKSALPRKQATAIYFNHEGRAYVIESVQADKRGNYDPFFDQIISTLRFTK